MTLPTAITHPRAAAAGSTTSSTSDHDDDTPTATSPRQRWPAHDGTTAHILVTRLTGLSSTTMLTAPPGATYSYTPPAADGGGILHNFHPVPCRLEDITHFCCSPRAGAAWLNKADIEKMTIGAPGTGFAPTPFKTALLDVRMRRNPRGTTATTGHHHRPAQRRPHSPPHGP